MVGPFIDDPNILFGDYSPTIMVHDGHHDYTCTHYYYYEAILSLMCVVSSSLIMW